MPQGEDQGSYWADFKCDIEKKGQTHRCVSHCQYLRINGELDRPGPTPPEADRQARITNQEMSNPVSQEL